jgi:prepilin-type processing-associated H-X9-DG protein
VNRLVNESEIETPARTILAAEVSNDWKAMGIGSGGGVLMKSHRPINPFYSIVGGTDEYQGSSLASPFYYGPPNDPLCGLKSMADIQGRIGLIDGSTGDSEANAVGRHHSGGDSKMGGTANFIYVDGHVDRKTILDTLKKREWGDKYYSLTGPNEVH